MRKSCLQSPETLVFFFFSPLWEDNIFIRKGYVYLCVYVCVCVCARAHAGFALFVWLCYWFKTWCYEYFFFVTVLKNIDVINLSHFPILLIYMPSFWSGFSLSYWKFQIELSYLKGEFLTFDCFKHIHTHTLSLSLSTSFSSQLLWFPLQRN